MNKAQKIVLAVVAAAMVGMLAVPPYHTVINNPSRHEERSNGYWSILLPPSERAVVNLKLLMLQEVVVCFAGAAVWFALKK